MVFLEVNKRDCPNVLYQELWMSKKKMPHMIFQNGSNGHDRQQTEILERYFFLGQPAVSQLNTFPRCSNTLALKKFPKNRSVNRLLLVFPILLPTDCCASVTYIEVGPTILWKCDLYLYIEVGSHHSPRPTLLPSHVGTTNCDNYVRLGENLLDVFF